MGFHTEHNFGYFGNLPDVFFGLAQIAQLITELFRFWGPAKIEIDNIGSKRRYFEKLAVVISVMAIEDSGLPILYLKFDFSTSWTNSLYFILELKHFVRNFAGLKNKILFNF